MQFTQKKFLIIFSSIFALIIIGLASQDFLKRLGIDFSASNKTVNKNPALEDTTKNTNIATSSNDWQNVLEKISKESGIDNSVATQNTIKTQTSTKKLTETEKMASNMLNGYFSLKQNDGTISDLDSTNLANSLVNQSIIVKKPTYNAQNIKLVINNSANIKNYGNEIAQILLKKRNTTNTDEMTIFEQAVVNDNPKNIVKLDTYSAIYSQMAKEFLAVNTPTDMLNIELSLLNSIAKISDDILDMRQYFNDSVIGANGFNNYQADFSLFTNSLQDIKAYLIKNNISYQQNESGYLFVVGI